MFDTITLSIQNLEYDITGLVSKNVYKEIYNINYTTLNVKLGYFEAKES